MKTPSTTAHVLVAVLLFTSFVIPILLLIVLFSKRSFKAMDARWDDLARWIDDCLD